MAAPLTLGQWQKRSDKGDWTYNHYLTWWKRAVGPRVAARNAASYSSGNYLAPIAPADLMKQAQTYVTSQTSPLIKQITDSITRSSAAGQKNILAAYDSLANAYKPLAANSDAGYATAAREVGGMNAELTNILQGTAGRDATDIGAQLSQINAPQASHDAFETGLSDLGKSLGATSYAYGTSTMGRLAGEGAAEHSYLSQLPAVATAGGVANARQLAQTSAQNLSDQVGQITAGVPGMVQQILGDLRSQEVEKAIATRAYGLDKFNAQTNRQQATAAATASKTAKYNPNADPYNPTGTAGGRVLRQLTQVAAGMFGRTSTPKGANGKPLIGVPAVADPVANIRAYSAVFHQAQQLLPQATPAQQWALAQRALVAAGYTKAAEYDPASGTIKTRAPAAVKPGTKTSQTPPDSKRTKADTNKPVPQVKGGERTQTNATTQQGKTAAAAPKKTAQEIRRNAADEADNWLDAHRQQSGPITSQNQTAIVSALYHYLTGHYPGIHHDVALNIARSAVARQGQ